MSPSNNLLKKSWKFPGFLITAILYFLCTNSCIEQFNPDLDDFDPSNLLVVEGQITDEEGPFRVKLSSTFEIDNNQLYGPPIYGADVQIFDDKGNQFLLFYTIEGWYETENKQLRGVVGNAYTLNITLEDGTQYESSPVLMKDVPEIDSVYFEVTQRTRFDEEFVLTEDWLDIFVDAKDSKGQTKYWKWDFEETWEIRMIKDSITIEYKLCESCPPLYTKINVEPYEFVRETCWVHVSSKNILIESTANSSIDAVEKFLVNSIVPKSDKLHIKYSILVKQSSLNKDLYKFWEQMEEINEQEGSMYDKIPVQVYGNIISCNNNSKALGFFSASAVKTKRIFVNFYEHSIPTKSAYKGCKYRIGWIPHVTNYYFGSVVPSSVHITDSYRSILLNPRNPVTTIDKFCSDCREYGTSVKPDFWKD